MADDGFQGFHLTALDARRFDFGNALRGYDRARVDQFREQVAEELGERPSVKNLGLVMKAATAIADGKVDGSRLSAAVKDRL